MGVKTTKAMELEEWQLDSPDAMFECLKDLTAQGYRGQVRAFHDANGALVWDLELGGGDLALVNAVLGLVVVLFGGVLESMTASVYEARFGA